MGWLEGIDGRCFSRRLLNFFSHDLFLSFLRFGVQLDVGIATDFLVCVLSFLSYPIT